MSVMCHECGHVFEGHENLFGKVCTRCDCYIPPRKELPIVTENKHKFALLRKAALDLVRKRWAGGNNANRIR